MAQFEKRFVQDLTQDIKIQQGGTIVFNNDNLSNVVGVALYNGKVPASVSGTVVGAVIAPDGATVPVDNGTISGNTVSITLTRACFALPGNIGVGIQVVTGDVATTVLKVIYNVELFATDTIVDPDSRITLSLAEIEAKLDEIPTILANAQTAIDGIEAQKDTMIASIASVAGQGTDTTLTQSGVAADAKATGDQVRDLKSALDSYFTPPENYDRLTDKTALANKAFDQTGNIIDGGSLLFPMYIPVEPNTTYVGSGFNYYGSVRAYDSTKTFVSGGSTTDGKKIITGANTHFIRFCVNNNATASSVVFQKGTAPSAITSRALLSEDVAISDNEFKPFDLDNLTGNSKLAASAILAFEIHCADPSAKVVLTRILKANSNVYAVVITVNGTTYNILNASISAYTETSYNEFNLSNVVYGYFVIDWSQLTSGVAYNGINATLKQTYVYPYIETQKYKNVEILLPAKINVAVGHEISLEFYNIINCSDINEYEVVATPNNASLQNLGDRLRINPASAGDTTITINLYKNSVLIATKQTVIHAVADSQPTIKAIFLGDSMTAQGFYLAELKRLLGANLTLYGTRSSTAEDSTGETQTVANEGRAGWSTTNYINDASYGGVANPFYNNGFDFSYYMTNNPSFNDVTDVFILLGTNDGFGNGVEVRYKTICDSIKAFNSNIRIHCMLPIPPIRNGYAFGIRSNNNYLAFKNYMFSTAKKYVSTFDGTEGYYIVPTNANLNCYYDFPQTEAAVNSRNPQLIAVGNDNVHPSKYGYYRFSDVIYGDIIANCN